VIFNFLKSLELEKGSTVVEIGCHHGYDTDTMLSICPHSKIYAFEPDPRNLKVLKERGLYEREGLEIIEACVSNKDGWETFYLSGGIPEGWEDARECRTGEWTASNSIKKPTQHISAHPWCKFEKEIKVKSIKLQTFCEEREINRIDFVWMDVQGAEDLVFEGAGSILNNIKYIYTEYCNTELYEKQLNLEQIKSKLKDFQVEKIFPNDVLFKNKRA
jgi:FkbM family methyltransferase